MEAPFSDNMCEIADSMGIAMYQRFTLNEASLFLRCPVEDVKRLQKSRKLHYIQVTNKQIEFFGYQLLEYLLSTVSGKIPVPRPQSTQDRILRIDEVREMVSLSRTTIWRLERKGEFPSRVPICAGSVGWRMSEIEAWIKNR